MAARGAVAVHVERAVMRPTAADAPGHGVAARVEPAVHRFVDWLDRFGETSYDFQTFYAGRYGRFAKGLYYRNRKVGTLAVAPIIFCEALVPSARRFFYARQRFPIADAHYAMGFARLFRHTGDRRHLDRAVHFLEELQRSACSAASGLGWGYDFDWVVIDRTIPAGTPLITTTPYVYEAFASVQAIAPAPRWLETMHAIAEHGFHDYRTRETGPGAAAAAYTPLPNDRGGVVNASAYRAFMLTRAARDLERPEYLASARQNLQFVLDAQDDDGSWGYAEDGRRGFVDHFHTCFVLKALVKIQQLAPRDDVAEAIGRGLRYYLANLFDAEGLPRPFSRAPRLIVYRRELYDYAECINLLTLVADRQPGAATTLKRAVDDVLTRWQRPDGSFRSRQLFVGWDNVPMHRWAQAQLFRSLCGLLVEGAE